MIIVIFILLLIIGAPIAVAIGLSSFVAMMQEGVSIDVFSRTIFAGIDSFTLMAIPFFIFAGDLMLAGGTSKRLIDFAKKLVGWSTGGLPIAGVMSSMLFAALSGSSPATVAAIGGIMIPSLNDAGYSRKFAIGLMTTAGTLGIIIPPSITLLVYGSSAEVSISNLFLAGIVPGVFIGLVLIIVSYIISKKEGFKPEGRASLGAVGKSFISAIWGILLPVIVLGGIYFGVFTPTEAAAVAIVYSLIIGLFVYKELTLRSLIDVTKKSVITSSMIMLVIAASNVFSWYLTFEQIPTNLASVLLNYANTEVAFLFLVIVILLLVGMFMDTSAAVLIFVPLFLPMVSQLGIDPIHFGIIMIVALSIGMITPPFGLNLFVASGISKVSLVEVIKSTAPFILVMIFALLVITFVPELSLFLLGIFE
ncbi:TRAP transporter large permease [Oceanobacillus iheyensis]|uniref:C4-dicarboxylate transport system permease large protein n=1 Tax=Oceanobacillus iheyensis (strain DSM 14371 / CIP 107618 / JCM 11309 / KCTC 3954 / HTE831) TaxID=221109 RepID=Q8ETL9_OCEIH|nr:TRAP transporter large permease [Oceanobacillus iheyensis]BAC12197.1 C4-dicarboxylate transport system permease large protein [Oceanobacillus iheyensis HTE831]